MYSMGVEGVFLLLNNYMAGDKKLITFFLYSKAVRDFAVDVKE